jgi:hypothetical protein
LSLSSIFSYTGEFSLNIDSIESRGTIVDERTPVSRDSKYDWRSEDPLFPWKSATGVSAGGLTPAMTQPGSGPARTRDPEDGSVSGDPEALVREVEKEGSDFGYIFALIMMMVMLGSVFVILLVTERIKIKQEGLDVSDL